MAKRKPQPPSAKRAIFVDRELDVGTGKLDVRVYRPTRDATGTGFGCEYEIKHGKKVMRARRVGGVDGLGALISALGVVDIELDFTVRSMPGAKLDEAARVDLRRMRPAAPKAKK